MQIQCVRIGNTPQACLAGDTGITQSCLAQGRLDWDRSILDIPAIAQVLRPGNVVIDVGAYIGDNTILFENLGCSVFAFEPRPDAYSCLQLNCPRSICLKKAAGLKGQTVVLTEPTEIKGDFSQRPVRNDSGGGTDAQSILHVMSLDELNPHCCHFLKVAAVGFEPYVLDGARALIERTRPIMQIEINEPALREHGFAGTEVIVDTLREWGYSFQPRESPRIGARTPSHLVCIPSGASA